MAGDELILGRSAGGIPYSLREGYPKFEFSDEGASASEQYIIHRDNMSAFYLLSMPPPIVFGDQVQLLSRRPMPGISNLVTKKLSFEPLKKDLPQDPFLYDGGYNNLYMTVDISYETNPINTGEADDNDPTTFIELSFDATAEFLKIPAAKTNFSQTGNEVGEEVQAKDVNIDTETPVTIVIPTTTYNANWKLAINPNFNLFRSLIGHVNQLTDPFFFDAPPETILFAGYTGRRSFLWDTDGQVTITPWDLTFKFIGRHIEGRTEKGEIAGWQHVYRPSAGYFERIRRANGSTLYETTSTWSQMFRSGGLL